MARAALSVTSITRAGVAPAGETNGDASNGHTMPNDGKTVLLVRNSNGGSTARTITFRIAGSVDGQGIMPKTVTLAAAASRYIGPFPTNQYGRNLLIDVDNAELKLSAYHVA